MAIDRADQPKGNDVISSSTSVCVLRQSSSKARDEDRRLIALYALFVKTAYRRFSQRLEPLTKNEDLGDALDQILNIQRDFSRFLASNDFSSTEISLDGDITNFFEAMSTSLALEEQKQETNLEMQLIEPNLHQQYILKHQKHHLLHDKLKKLLLSS